MALLLETPSLSGFKEVNGHVGEVHVTRNRGLPSDSQPTKNWGPLSDSSQKKRNATINYVFGSGSFPNLASYETSTPAKVLIAAS